MVYQAGHVREVHQLTILKAAVAELRETLDRL